MKILATVFSLFAAAALRAAEPPVEKPNIILIVADDLGYGDIGPFGATKNRTPNLDRMAREGLKLTSFYGAPVCTPSRAQILTGSYAKRVSLPQVLPPAAPIGLSHGEHSVAELLKAQGYATIAIGKWHLGDQPEFLPTQHGFDQYFGLPYSNDMGGPEKPIPGQKKRIPPLPLLRGSEVIETVSQKGQDSLTARYTEEAVKFIGDHQHSPFFLYLPHTAVHVPIHPGDAFRGKSANGAYGDWVEELDWSVGQVLDTVHHLDLSARTLVIFTSDNGPWLIQGSDGGTASPLRGGKGGTYEGGVREPTLAWWPGKIPAGGTSDAITANYDFLPTFVALAGGVVPADHPIDGKDLSPLLFGQTHESPHEAHYYFAGNTLQAVRAGPWKLAITRQNENRTRPVAPAPEAGIPFTPTLYNLDSDIGETNDVAAQHPEVIERLRGLITKMDADLGVRNLGPGVRPPGRVAKPVGLWLPGHGPSAEDLAAQYDVHPLDKLKLGDTVDRDEAPQIAGKALTISLDVEPKAAIGIILAQGGSANGYALHLSHGHLIFTVRERQRPSVITADTIPEGRFHIEARLARDGALTLAIAGQIVAHGKAPGLIPSQPAEDFCLGDDNGTPVGDYGDAGPFQGLISGLKVTAE